MLTDQFNNTVEKYRLLKENEKVIVGVSGGPDSVALLYLLRGIVKEYDLTLHVVHVDHKLRKSSFTDAEFVKRLCCRLKIPLTIKTVDVRRLSVKGSIEEIAREARMKAFFETGRKIKARTIALGHNLDDQAETVLMRLLRGSGLYGLSGILPKREMAGGFKLIRPLIESRRKDIESFLKRRQIKWRIDESNLEDLFLRNRIRHQLLPLLEKKYNRNIKDILSNTAHMSAFDYDYLLTQAQKAAGRLGKKISIKKFSALHTSIRRLVLRLNFQRLKGDTRTLTFRHIREIEDLIANRPANSIVDLPGNIFVKKTGDASVIFQLRKNGTNHRSVPLF